MIRKSSRSVKRALRACLLAFDALSRSHLMALHPLCSSYSPVITGVNWVLYSKAKSTFATLSRFCGLPWYCIANTSLRPFFEYECALIFHGIASLLLSDCTQEYCLNVGPVRLSQLEIRVTIKCSAVVAVTVSLS